MRLAFTAAAIMAAVALDRQKGAISASCANIAILNHRIGKRCIALNARLGQ
jgi:hypothetical protein